MALYKITAWTETAQRHFSARVRDSAHMNELKGLVAHKKAFIATLNVEGKEKVSALFGITGDTLIIHEIGGDFVALISACTDMVKHLSKNVGCEYILCQADNEMIAKWYARKLNGISLGNKCLATAKG